VNAAIEMAVGAGAQTLALATTVVTLVILALLPPIEAFFEEWADRRGVSSHTAIQKKPSD
jgi:uncharacterized membrane protein YhiD involved in acid resistance